MTDKYNDLEKRYYPLKLLKTKIYYSKLNVGYQRNLFVGDTSIDIKKMFINLYNLYTDEIYREGQEYIKYKARHNKISMGMMKPIRKYITSLDRELLIKNVAENFPEEETFKNENLYFVAHNYVVGEEDFEEERLEEEDEKLEEEDEKLERLEEEDDKLERLELEFLTEEERLNEILDGLE